MHETKDNEQGSADSDGVVSANVCAIEDAQRQTVSEAKRQDERDRGKRC